MQKLYIIFMLLVVQVSIASQPSATKPSSAVTDLLELEKNKANSRPVLIGHEICEPKKGGGLILEKEIVINGVPLLGASDDPKIKALRWRALVELLTKYQTK